MDATALTLCMENGLPIYVFNMDDERNIDRIVSGERVGTLVDDMSEMTDELLADAGERMAKSVEATRDEFGTVRTGRASPALLDRIVVDYYGAPTPLKQLATINAPEARLLTVQPYDQARSRRSRRRSWSPTSGSTPNNDGKLIRLAIPELNEERRTRAGQGRAPHRRGGARRDPQHPPRRHARPARAQGAPARSAPTTSTAPRSSCRSSPTRASPSSTAALKAKEAEILEV